MDARELLSADGRAVVAICSQLGLDDPTAAYTLTQWNELARRIQGSAWKRPAALAGRSAGEIAGTLGIPPVEAERIAGLLGRGGRLALELENLVGRGIWAVTRADATYPARLRQTLKHQAPAVLFGAGELRLLAGGVAVVGSRNLDPAGLEFAQAIGRRCAQGRLPVVSGGARGTDRIAMQAALDEEGVAVGVLADNLERTVRQPDLRQLLLEERLVLLTPYAPTAGFSVGAAMGRNKVIYGLADYGIVVSSEFQQGGTWAGAVEALRAEWCPVFVRDGVGVPRGNRELLKWGAIGLPDTEQTDLPEWLKDHAGPRKTQPDLLAVMESKRPYRTQRRP